MSRLEHLADAHVHRPEPEPHVPAFSAWWRDETGTELMGRLGDPGLSGLDDPIIVVWGEHTFAAVVEFSRADGLVTLTTDPVSESLAAAARTRDGLPHPVLPSLGELLRASIPGDHLVVLTSGGRKHTIIGSGVARTGIGYGRGIWNTLTPSGAP